MEQRSCLAGKVDSCIMQRNRLADSVCITCQHQHSWNAATLVHCCNDCRSSTSAVRAPRLQVYTPASEWQYVQLLHNQVAVFAGVMLQYATGGAIPAALHAYGAAECQPLVRRTVVVGLCLILSSLGCGLLRMDMT
jgi:hypothetical protein